jgi:signal transduction histidine kinase
MLLPTGIGGWIVIRGICSVATMIFCLLASPACSTAQANERLPRSVLILDQSTSLRPWPSAIIGGMRSFLWDRIGPSISFYVEHLDLYRFNGPGYEHSLQEHFRAKYRETPVGVIVAIGSSTLDYAFHLRAEVWPAVPIVFAAVAEETARNLPPDVTGTSMQMTLANMIKASRMLFPDLKGFAIVGDRLELHPYYRHFAEELPAFSRQLEFIDLTGLSIREVRQRVATLPDRTTILYTGINFDSDGTYVAADMLPVIAEVASRPIIVDGEAYFGTGATGGLILSPDQIGREAAGLVLRILNGERVSDIPVTRGEPPKPIFDWRQLQRWNISEDRLPAGSDVRFRQPTIWQQYRVHIWGAGAVLLLQTMLILWLLYEHRRRHSAEVATRNTMIELTQMNRLATAGGLSASIAHEVNQPLTGIVTRACAALRWLTADKPDIDKARDALNQIVSAGHRASDIIAGIRSMFRKDDQAKTLVDINKLIWTVLELIWIDLRKYQIELETKLSEQLPLVLGNEVQLQQAILNLVMNAIEAMHSTEHRVLTVVSDLDDAGAVHVSIEDTGTGIDPSKFDCIFKPLFTTKTNGMGMGLSICRSIIEGHDGWIWASPGAASGTKFEFSLPVRQ